MASLCSKREQKSHGVSSPPPPNTHNPAINNSPVTLSSAYYVCWLRIELLRSMYWVCTEHKMIPKGSLPLTRSKLIVQMQLLNKLLNKLYINIWSVAVRAMKDKYKILNQQLVGSHANLQVTKEESPKASKCSISNSQTLGVHTLVPHFLCQKLIRAEWPWQRMRCSIPLCGSSHRGRK